MENNKIELDDITPASFSHLIERHDDVLLQHGGVVTRMYFDKVELMDLDAFLQQEVPKLKRQQQELTIIRDSVSKSVSLITGDQVIKYHLTNMEECFADELAKLIKVDEVKTFIPDIHYPLIGYVDKADYKAITVLIENKSFMYRTKMFGGDQKEFATRVHLPPIWLAVRINRAGTVLGARIAAVPEKALRTEDTVLYRLPLPNIHVNGELCLGTAAVKDAFAHVEQPTDGMIIQVVVDQIFNSLWNYDLIDRDLAVVMNDAYKKARVINRDDFDSFISYAAGNQAVAMQIRIVGILTDPNGWKLLKYSRMSRNGREDLMTASLFLEG